MDIVLDDGTASGEAVLAVSQDLADMAGGDVDDLFEDTNLPEDATVEPYEEDGYVGQRYVFEDTELTEFNDEDLSITYDEEAGQYEVAGAMDFGAGQDFADMPPGLADSFDVSLSVTFPGEVIEHDGELDGQTVTWTPAMGETTEIHAIAEEGGSGVPTWLWVALAVVGALVVIGLVVVLSRRRGVQGTPSESAAQDDVTRDLSHDASATDNTTSDADFPGSTADDSR